jgi:predicted transcriptional regulator
MREPVSEEPKKSASLEAEVLRLLETSSESMTPGQVQRALDRPLAYTTVMTTLVRLHGKGSVTRRRVGRAFTYLPTFRADDRAAQSMTEALALGSSPEDVLSRFVSALSPEEEAALRRILDQGSEEV